MMEVTAGSSIFINIINTMRANYLPNPLCGHQLCMRQVSAGRVGQSLHYDQTPYNSIKKVVLSMYILI